MGWFDGFRDRAVLVTGASSGIGRATAVAFAAAGARVGLVARRREVLEEVAETCRAQGAESVVLPADVTRRQEVRACYAAARAALGPLHVVVNNAGILIPAPVLDIAPEDLEAMLRVNLFGALFVLQEAVHAMQATGGGVVVNVASLAGRRGVSPLGGYSATKFALVGLTEALRTEIRDSPVHVALVLPGVIETPMVEHVTQDQEFLDFWPNALNMPPSWVVWAIFAAARFRLIEISVPPGAATIEKLAALAPGVADTVVHWAQRATRWLGETLHQGGRSGSH